MRLPVLLPFLLVTIVGLAACDRADPPSAVTAPDAAGDAETLVTVNGTPITRSDLFAYAGFDAAPPGTASGVIEELINLELLRQEALRQGIEQEAEIRMILRNLETNLLASQLIERQVAGMPVSDAQIRAEYDAQVAQLGTREYRASHILVATESEAAALIGQLGEGADFAALAAAHSMDTSGQRGGDLGWFVPQQMVPEFSNAVKALEPGAYTEKPVRSPFGAHVILLQDTRALEAPALDEVRGQIEEILQTRALQAYVEGLRAKAEIRFTEPPED